MDDKEDYSRMTMEELEGSDTWMRGDRHKGIPSNTVMAGYLFVIIPVIVIIGLLIGGLHLFG